MTKELRTDSRLQEPASRGTQTHDARIERAASLETSVREHVQHLAILAENIGFEFLDVVRIRDSTPMLQQDRADRSRLARTLRAMGKGE